MFAVVIMSYLLIFAISRKKQEDNAEVHPPTMVRENKIVVDGSLLATE